MADEHRGSKTEQLPLDGADTEPTRVDYDRAMRRLVYLAGFGSSFILLFALGSSSRVAALNVFGIAVMLAGAALTTGGLLGFLFGIPYAQPVSSTTPDNEPKAGASGSMDRDDNDTLHERPRYRPNSNLEQVSDWLTKIIVGVGLVEFNPILRTVWNFAGYVAIGLGRENIESGRAFVCAVLAYFAVCGFIFGFLWARLYLLKWFSDADDVHRLRKTVLRLQEQSDAIAIAMAIRQMNRGPSEPPISDREVHAAVKSASHPVRAQIFDSVVGVADRKDATETQLDGAISILRALIAADARNAYHQNHAQLSYALRRRQPPDWTEAISSISRAIEIRNTSSSRGWRFYEFHRARCRIKQGGGVISRIPTDEALKTIIVRDLAAAARDKEGWTRWISNDREVFEWLELNKIDETALNETRHSSEPTADK